MLEQARAAADKRQFDNAIELADRAWSRYPSNTAAAHSLWFRAQKAFVAGDVATAIDWLTKSLAEEADADGSRWLADMERVLEEVSSQVNEANAAHDRHDFSAAISILENILRAYPGVAVPNALTSLTYWRNEREEQTLARDAQDAYTRGDLETAVLLLRRLVQLQQVTFDNSSNRQLIAAWERELGEKRNKEEASRAAAVASANQLVGEANKALAQGDLAGAVALGRRILRDYPAVISDGLREALAVWEQQLAAQYEVRSSRSPLVYVPPSATAANAFSKTTPIDSRGDAAVQRRVNSVLVTGTGSVLGFVQREDGALQAVAMASLNDQKRLDDLVKGAVGSLPSLKDRTMLLGVAAAHEPALDLILRVIGLPFAGGDQSTNGAYSASHEPLYASLRGVVTASLECHSNGAMVCLRAIAQRDVTKLSERLSVRLDGPQITSSAIAEWAALLKDHRITTLEINLMEHDPVPAASYALGPAPWSKAALSLARVGFEYGTTGLTGIAERAVEQAAMAVADRGPSAAEIFWAPRAAWDLKAVLEKQIPGVRVHVLRDPNCLSGGLLGCHYLSTYDAVLPSAIDSGDGPSMRADPNPTPWRVQFK